YLGAVPRATCETWSPMGKTGSTKSPSRALAFARTKDGSWELRGQKIPEGCLAEQAAWSPDESRVAVPCADQVAIFSAQSGRRIDGFKLPSNWAGMNDESKQVVWSTDVRTIGPGSSDEERALIRWSPGRPLITSTAFTFQFDPVTHETWTHKRV